MTPERQKRIDALQQRMQALQLNLTIIAKPENIFYYSGFNPILNSHKSYVVVPAEGEPTLLVHSLRGDHAREEAWLGHIAFHGKWGDKQPLDQDPAGAIAKIARRQPGANVRRIGLELEFLPFAQARALAAALGEPETVDLSGYFNSSRLIKDRDEINLLRKSARLADRAMEAMIDALGQGASEAEACTEGQYRMRLMWQTEFPDHEISGFGGQEGGIIDALNCWILTGPRISYGCDCPTSRRPAHGELVLPMVWAKLGGYHAENERSLYVGELDEFKRRTYDAMLRAREAVFRTIRPGIAFEDLYLAAAQVFEAAGFGGILPGRVGHGIGLSAHEYPSLQEGNRIKLQPGMAFTVEPGLMSAEWGGVRHADTVLVTETGYESLTRSDRGWLKI
ncbi:Xaa-Pro peptidase family protein [Paenibacillus macerans]|uniref:M24 family metallopeptidase n=2 Tax=Paenibacillus macerans TaxID=44252 RepID=UPI003D26A940